LHDPEGLAALLAELRQRVGPNTRLIEIDAHINDDAFAQTALQVFDTWVAEERVIPGKR
jgi:uncharacterized protein (UPF0261 family)